MENLFDDDVIFQGDNSSCYEGKKQNIFFMKGR